MNSIYGNPISVEDIPDGVQKCNCKKECNCIGLRNTIKGYLLKKGVLCLLQNHG